MSRIAITLLMSLTLPLSTYALQAEFQSAQSVLNEGSSTTHRIMVRIDSAAEKNLKIPFKLSGSADPKKDLSLRNSSSLDIKRGQTQGFIEIKAREDRMIEGEEFLKIELLATKDISIGSQSKHSLHVEDNEAPPARISFQTQNLRVEETKQTLSIKLALDRVAPDDVQVEFITEGSATSRQDYRLQRSSIRIRKGSKDGLVSLEIEDDEDKESDETITIKIDSVQGAVLGTPNSLKITIAANDEPLPDTAWSQSCYESTAASLSYKYCITKTPGSRNQNVLYYWHGYFGSEKDWTEGSNSELKRQLRMNWDAAGVDAPTVVSISMGISWMLNENADADGGPASLVPIADIAIPNIESKHFGGSLQGRRLLMGVSMGGFNGLTMLFKRSKLWERAVIIAPLMPMCNPYMSDEMIYACLANDPYEKNSYLALQAHKLVQKYFPSPHQWDEANPLHLGQKHLGPNFLPLYLTSGDIDSFGFFTKNKELGELGLERNAPLQWVPTHGEHGYFDVDRVADYLSRTEP